MTLFPHCSKSELCLTLERAGNDFGVAVAAILGENNMANCLVDYENTTNQQPGKLNFSKAKNTIDRKTVI